MTAEDEGKHGLKSTTDTVAESDLQQQAASVLFPLRIPVYNFDVRRRTIATRGINYSFSFLAAVPPTKTTSAPPRLAADLVDQDVRSQVDKLAQSMPDLYIKERINFEEKQDSSSPHNLLLLSHDQSEHNQSPSLSSQCNKEPNNIQTAASSPTVNISTPLATPSRTRSTSRLPVRKSVSSPSRVSSPQPKESPSITNNNDNPPHTISLFRSTSDGEDSKPRKTPATAAPSKKSRQVNGGVGGRSMKNGKTNGAAALKKVSTKTAAGEANVSMPGTNTNQDDDDEEEDDIRPMRLTPSERRRREAKRAEQIKFWRAREEREARDARLVARRKLMAEGQEAARRRRMQQSGAAVEELSRQDSPSSSSRKAVKFNLRLNRVIEIQSPEQKKNVAVVDQQQR